MNEQQAIKSALSRAKKSGYDRHVVLDDLDCQGYAVASDYDLDTFYNGARVLWTCTPSGDIYKGEGY